MAGWLAEGVSELGIRLGVFFFLFLSAVQCLGVSFCARFFFVLLIHPPLSSGG
jgi:hypothetical protein